MTYGTTTYGTGSYGAGEEESSDVVLYWAVQPSATADWADNSTGGAQIRAGQDGAGSALAAGSFGNQAYTAAGTLDMEALATGLTPGASYEFGFVLYHAGTDTYSNVEVSSLWKTTTIISGVPASASASGSTATISTGIVVVASEAQAAAAGAVAAVFRGRTVGATAAQAAASGSSAAVSRGFVLAATPAQAAASGAAATVSAGLTIGASPASASAAGASAAVIAGEAIGASPASALAAGAAAQDHCRQGDLCLARARHRGGRHSRHPSSDDHRSQPRSCLGRRVCGHRDRWRRHLRASSAPVHQPEPSCRL
ncbi:MAG: hypothetical protein IPN11_14550 [Opitutaceae bacterium]|nr:hypothetical protein [Opitutaceae bacterium]